MNPELAKTAEELAAQREQAIYLVLPRLVHDEWCRDWDTCCSAKVNAGIILDLSAEGMSATREANEVAVALNEYHLDKAYAELYAEIEKSG